jgi:hypothetical protein
MRSRRLAGHVASVIVGLTIGAVTGLAASSVLNAASESPAPPAGPAAATPGPHRGPAPIERIDLGAARLLLVWVSGGLPEGAEAFVERIEGVEHATTVIAGTDWAQETTVHHLPKGAVPLEVALVEPREYARFVAPSARREIAGLNPGEAVVAGSTATSRAALQDGVLRLVDRIVRVRGSVDPIASNGYEALIAGDVPSSWVREDRFLLLRLERPRARETVERKMRSLLAPGQSLRVRAKGETPFLRYGDAVLPQLLIKETFGEFAAVPLPNGNLEIDPTWLRANIHSRRVPILGEVTCHRALIPQLRAALREVREEGLGQAIDRSQYGGCFGPRFIGLEPHGRLSHHAWGAAIDINVSENPFGTKADQDPRLVQIMERHGFTWGGRWLVPDGMHFEWVAFP